MAFEAAGGRCVFSSEYDRFAQRTYAAFHGESPDFGELYPVDPPGDITRLPPERVPDHDILAAGFPCQPFSLAGVSKKQSLGRPHGFDDPTQGTLFFNLKEILRVKQPPAFVLENVKHLERHDHGNTFRLIRHALEVESGYSLHYKVIDAAGWLPQHRERIFLVGFHPDLEVDPGAFAFPNPPPRRLYTLADVLLPEADPKYTLGQKTWATLLRHKAYHVAAGNGFGYGLLEPPYKDKVSRTISARYHKDGAEVLIWQPGSRPRRLTPRECARLQGLPDKYQAFFDGRRPQPVSDTQAYRQLGNSVAVPVVRAIALRIVEFLGDAR